MHFGDSSFTVWCMILEKLKRGKAEGEEGQRKMRLEHRGRAPAREAQALRLVPRTREAEARKIIHSR